MNIVLLKFQETFMIEIAGKIVTIVAFETHEHGNVKFGIDAPRTINVHREEIYHAIKEKQMSNLVEEEEK